MPMWVNTPPAPPRAADAVINFEQPPHLQEVPLDWGEGQRGTATKWGGKLNLEQPEKVDSAEDIRPIH